MCCMEGEVGTHGIAQVSPKACESTQGGTHIAQVHRDWSLEARLMETFCGCFPEPVRPAASLTVGYFLLSLGIGFFNKWALGSRYRGGAGFTFPFFYSGMHMVPASLPRPNLAFPRSRPVSSFGVGPTMRRSSLGW